MGFSRWSRGSAERGLGARDGSVEREGRAGVGADGQGNGRGERRARMCSCFTETSVGD